MRFPFITEAGLAFPGSLALNDFRKDARWAANGWLTAALLLLLAVPIHAGSILREVYQGIPGNAISDLTSNPAYPNQPTLTNFVSDFFEAPVDFDESYGQRMHGYVVPPVTGNYTFWIASDDNGELYLSTDDTPAKQRLICSVPEWTSSREWGRFAQQQSAPIRLNAGQTYYISALSKEGNGGDNLAVRWLRPDGRDEAPIPATYLLPFGTSFTPPIITEQPTNTTVIEGQNAVFVVKVSNVDLVRYEWRRNGVPLVNPVTAGGVLTFGPVTLADNGASFSARLTNSLGATNTTSGILTVVPDQTPPQLVGAFNLGTTNVLLTFSEPIATAKVADVLNYTLTGGLQVVAAGLGTDPRTILLTTSPLTFGNEYQVTVRQLTDRAQTPNVIAPGAAASFIAAEFVAQNIGGAPGGMQVTRLAGGGFEVTAAGAAINAGSDQFGYAWQQRNGDFDLQVRVEALRITDPYVQVGLMARANLETNAPFAGVFTSSAQVGCYFESRNTSGASSTTVTPPGGFPYNGTQTWLRLRRVGNSLTGFASLDGTTWTSIGSLTLGLGSPTYVGLAVSSRKPETATTVRFLDYGATASLTTGPNVTDREPLGPSTRRTGLVFSEIMYHPRPPAGVTNNLEFIELYNAGPIFEDLGGWQITGAVNFTFPAGFRIEAGEFALVAADPPALQAVQGVAGGLGPWTGSLNNDGETVELRDRFGALKLAVEYSPQPSWPVAADGAGHSLVLIRPSYGEADPRAWAASEWIGGSPGGFDALRPTPLRGVVINEFLAHTDDPQVDFVELYNGTTAEANLAGCVLTDNPATNRFRLPAGTVIPARGFLSFDQDQLGFRLSAAGETIYLLSPDGRRVLDAIRFDSQENGVASGRSPNGSGVIRRLLQPTPGAANATWRPEEVVLNEIMFNPISGSEDDEYVELLNRSDRAVDLTGWRFTDGIDFEFPAGSTLTPGGFLVVARNAARLQATHPLLPAASVRGDFTGGLANGGERVALAKPDDLVSTNALGDLETNRIFIVVSEVHYGDEGRGSRWADGGGSSLELIDPNADLRQPSNWADSDETQKAPWTPLTFTGRLDHGMDGYAPDRLQINLQGAGECLVDDVAFSVGGGANLVSDPGFETGSGWSFAGNHSRSRLQTGGAAAGSRSLRLVAQGDGDTGPNCVRSLLASPPATGTQGTIRAQARWLRGWPELLIRTRGNWIELAGRLTVPTDLGTPGLPNSRRVANAGPAISEVRHTPVLPAATQPVVITARVADPEGVAAVQLKFRLDPVTSVTTLSMRDDGTGGDVAPGDGVYSATITGRSAGTTVAFRVEANDAGNPVASAVFPPAFPDSEGLIRWGDEAPSGSFAHYHLWATQKNTDDFNNQPGLNNNFRDATLVVGNFRAIYGAGFRTKGSPFHGGRGDLAVTVPADDRLLGVTDRIFAQTGNGGAEATGMRGQVANWIAGQLGLPHLHSHYMRLFFNGERYSNVTEDLEQPNNYFAEGFFPSAGEGDLYKIAVWFEFQDDDSGFGAVGATLQSFTSPGLGLKPARYRWNWQTRGWLGTANNLTNIFNLVNAANATTDYLNRMQSVADVEQWMRVFAFNRICGNWDSFTYSVGQNMFVYFQPGERAKLLPWDIDFVLGEGEGATAPLGGGSFGGSSQDPVADRLYNDPAFRRALWRAYLDAVNGPLQPAQYTPQIESRRAALQNNGFMVGSGGELADPRIIATYIEARRNYIQQQLTAADRAFAITSNAGNDFSSTQPVATLTGTAPFAVATIEVNGIPYPLTWTNPNTFRVLVPLTGSSNPLSLVGLDRRGRPVPGATDSVTVTYDGAVPQPEDFIVFNEIQYDPAAPGASYLELFNRSTSTPFDLSGFRLEGVGYTFPEGAVLAAGAYLVLARDRAAFALTYGATVPVFDEFPGSLDNGGETLRLVKPGAAGADVVIDDVRFDDDPPWPAGANGFGPSLQLIDPAQDTYRAGNWTATVVGDPNRVTPGRANSVRATLDPFPLVWINEVLPNNVNGPTDNAGEREPFIEIYNRGTNAVDLAPYFLTDDYGSPTKWQFPANTLLGPGQFLRLWADGETAETAAGALHVGFRLNPTTGSVALVRLQGSPAQPAVMDYINYAQLPAGRSLGSFPDGEPRNRRSFFHVTPGAANDPAFPAVTVVLNEFMASNQKTLINPVNGKKDDWFELYNGGTNAVDLTGYFLTDSLINPKQFAIPPGFVIPPDGFLLVWADEETQANTNGATQLHVSFKLSTAGEELGLYGPDGILVDGFSFGVQTNDISQGRFPDGQAGGLISFEAPTPGAANLLAGGNRPPVLEPLADRTIAEGLRLTFTAVATDDPTQTLRYSLGSDAPPEATIDDVSGVFSWTPTEAQGPGAYVFTVRATDNGTPPRTGGARISVTVAEVNRAPVFGELPDRVVDERSPLLFSLMATDPDLPANPLTYSFDGAVPAGLVLDPASGAIAWTPTEAQGPGIYTLQVRATDQATSSASVTGSFRITVNEVNNPPDLADIQPQNVVEGQPLALDVIAADGDAPPAALRYSLEGTVPAGMRIDGNSGRITWSPTEAQGPGNFVVIVRATEQNAAALSAAKTFGVTVTEVNEPPQLAALNDLTVEEGTVVRFTASASDSDLPAQKLTFSLDPGAPAAAAIDGITGEFVWPTSADAGASTNTFSIRVTDSGPGALNVARPVKIVVTPRFRVAINEIMYQPTAANASYIELVNASSTTTWDISGHRLAGDTLAFTFPANTVLAPGGLICVARDVTAFTATYGAAPRLAGAWTGSLGLAGDYLRLLPPSPSDTAVDAVRFTAAAPWPAAAGGAGASLQLIDPRRDNARVANWSGAPAYTGPRQLVVMDSLWRYFQSGPVAAAWKDNGFADTAWPQGRGLLYVETADLPAPKSTPLTLGQNTYYFRTTFTLPNVPAGAVLKLSNVIDDGAVFYLNGTEIHRQNLAPDAVVDFNTPASPNVADATLAGPFTVPASALRAGVNVLAVEVHQSGIGSSDIVMGCSLTLEGGDLPGRTPGAANNVAADRSEFPPVWINEVLPNNTAGFTDNHGDRDPWIELINTGRESVSLDGWWLTDAYPNLTKWAFPTGTMIPAGGFLVVFADGEAGESTAAEPHTGFRLGAAAGSVALVRQVAGAPEVADFADYAGHVANQSLVSQPDGQPFVRVKSSGPTPGVANVANRAPVLGAIGNQRVDEGVLLGFTASATDPDPGQELTYSLLGSVPAGVIFNPETGGFAWVPTEQQGPGSFTFTLRVTDNGSPAGSDEETFTITVDEVNLSPSAIPVSPQSATVGQKLSFIVGAGDPDFPAQGLVFSLEGAPAGAAINGASGEFSWTPIAAQVGTRTFDVRISDNGIPPKSVTTPIRVTVTSAGLQLVPTATAAGALQLAWLSESGVTYRIETMPALGQAWQRVAEVNGTGGVLTHTVAASAATTGFYRVTTP